MRRTCRECLSMACLVIAGVFLVSSQSVLAAGAEEREVWGNVPGLVEPHPDSKGREGYWWWPRSRQAMPDGVEGGGNRGRVFGVPIRSETLAESRQPTEPPPPTPFPWGPKPFCGSALINFIFFAPDSIDIRPEGKNEIQKLVERLNLHPGDTMVCTGHTDDIGPASYNLLLGERRAQAVKDSIVEQGIDAARIEVKSMGETTPAVPNDSGPNRALNRRVEFDFILGK